MISLANLEDMPITFDLPANTPARARPPGLLDDEECVSIEDRIWLPAAPKPRIRAFSPDGDASVSVHFDWVSGQLVADTVADWVWAAAETKLLRARVLEQVLDLLDASMPQVPPTFGSSYDPPPTLAWPRRPGSGGKRQQNDKLTALRDFSERTDVPGMRPDDAWKKGSAAPLDRLKDCLGSCPKQANTRIEITSSVARDVLTVTWAQSGRFDLLWGAECVCWSENGRRLVIVGHEPELAERRRSEAECAQLLVMARAFETVFGSCAEKVHFRLQSKGSGMEREATLTLGPGNWGFDLPLKFLQFETDGAK